jgi:hypothetical protein
MPATEIPILVDTVTPAAAVTAARGVDFSGAQIAAAGQKPFGIAKTAGSAGVQLAVLVKGVAIVEAGGVIAVGDPLTMDAQGRAVTATALAIAAGATAVTSAAANGATALTGGVLPVHVFGDAKTAASGAGVFIEALMR